MKGPHRCLELLGLAPDRGKEDLDGLHEGEPVQRHHPFKRPVENLRIARLRWQLNAQGGRFAGQPVDRVDLPIVAQRREHLGLLGGGGGVGRIPSVPEGDRRFEFRTGEFWKVPTQRLGVSADLVDSTRMAQRGNVDRKLTLDLQVELKCLATPNATRPSRQSNHLPIDRLVDMGERSKGLRTRLRVPLEDDIHSPLTKDRLHTLLHRGVPSHF